MSLEDKIKAILEKKPAVVNEKATLPNSNMNNGDATPPKQGDSKDAPIIELDKDNSGKSAAAVVNKETPPTPKGDAKSVKVQSMEGVEVDVEVEKLDEAFTRRHFVAIADALKEISDHKTRMQMADSHIKVFKKDNPRFDEGRFRKAANAEGVSESVVIESVDLKADIAALFEGQEGLAEGFVTKATSIFEAAVVARVNAEVVKVSTKLEEQAATELAELKTTLSEQVDQYMTYVVEGWMKENQVAVDQGLRTEIAEGFISGLKTLFEENYIEVPEDKVAVLETLSTDLDTTKARLNEEVDKTLALTKQIVELEKKSVFESASKGMIATDADRFLKLIEGVEFDSKELFAEKVAVIKEAHFKKSAPKSAETILAEQTGSGDGSEKVVSDTVQSYVNAIKRKTSF